MVYSISNRVIMEKPYKNDTESKNGLYFECRAHVLREQWAGIGVYLWRLSTTKAAIHFRMSWIHNSSPQSCLSILLNFTVAPPHWDQEALTFHTQSCHHGNDTKNHLVDVAHNFPFNVQIKDKRGHIDVQEHKKMNNWLPMQKRHKRCQIKKFNIKYNEPYTVWIEYRLMWVSPVSNWLWCMYGPLTWRMISDTGSWST